MSVCYRITSHSALANENLDGSASEICTPFRLSFSALSLVRNFCVDHTRKISHPCCMAKQKKGMTIFPSESLVITGIAPSIRTRNARRQATPPIPIGIESQSENKPSGVSRVNKEIAALIARKDPVLNRVSKKSKNQLSKQKKQRMEAKMIKAAVKAVKQKGSFRR
jgi:hypothetical protein